MWLMLFLFPPTAIVLMWSFRKDYGLVLKILLTIAFSLASVLFVFGFIDGSKQAVKDSVPQPTAIVQETEKEEKVDQYGWSEDNYATFAADVLILADNYITNYKTQWDLNDGWSFARFDNRERIVAYTLIELKNQSELVPMLCVFSDNPDNGQVAYNFLMIGDKVYLDDGSCPQIYDYIQNNF